ncbi:hypothetical protein [Clostridium sp. C2-6-12]|nr:hypothetical protein [Clostridium sp. C2-6-12]
MRIISDNRSKNIMYLNRRREPSPDDTGIGSHYYFFCYVGTMIICFIEV